MNKLFNLFLCLLLLQVSLCKILQSKQISSKDKERSLLSLAYKQKENKAYELMECILKSQKKIINYLMHLQDKARTKKQFRKLVDDHYHRLKEKFKQANFQVEEMEDRAFSTVNGIMSSVGIGLS